MTVAKSIISQNSMLNVPASGSGFVFQNSSQTDIAIINLRFTPLADNVSVPLELHMKDGVQQADIPMPHMPNETVEVNGVIVLPGNLLSGKGIYYAVHVDGFTQAWQTNASSPRMFGAMAVRVRPPLDTLRRIVLTTPERFGALMDEFSCGKSAERAVAALELKDKGSGEITTIFGTRTLGQETRIRRKFYIPPNTEVTCVTQKYVDIYYQWALLPMQQRRF